MHVCIDNVLYELQNTAMATFLVGLVKLPVTGRNVVFKLPVAGPKLVTVTSSYFSPATGY